MNDTTTPKIPESTPPPRDISLPTDKICVINIDELKPNSVLVIQINVNGPHEKMAVAPVFSKLLAPYANELRSKRITVMLMTANESITTIAEEEMNMSGWFKKEELLIITPDKKDFNKI